MRTTQKLPAWLAGMTALVISAGTTVASAQDDVRRAGDSTEQTVRDQTNASDDLDRRSNDADDQDYAGRRTRADEQDLADNASRDEPKPATRSVPPAHATRMPEQASSTGPSTSSTAGADQDDDRISSDRERSSDESSTASNAADDDSDATRADRSSDESSSTASNAARYGDDAAKPQSAADGTREESAAMSTAQRTAADDRASSENDDSAGDEDAARSVPPAHSTRMPRQMARNGGTNVDAERDQADSSDDSYRGAANDEDADSRDNGGTQDRDASVNDDEDGSPDESTTKSIPPAHATRMPPPRPTASSSASPSRSAGESTAAERDLSSDSSADSVVTNRSSEEPAPHSGQPEAASTGTVREAMPSASKPVVARNRSADDANDVDAGDRTGSAYDSVRSSDSTAQEDENGTAARSVPPEHATRMPREQSSNTATASANDEPSRSGTDERDDAQRSAGTTADTLANRDDEQSGIRGEHPDALAASAKFDALDANHDGYIDASEAAASDALDAQFSTLDTSGDGRLSVSEFRAASNIALIRVDRGRDRQQQQ